MEYWDDRFLPRLFVATWALTGVVLLVALAFLLKLVLGD
jgi:hypothetical protein